MFRTDLLQTSIEVRLKPSFFAKPPFRSYFFVGDTLLLILSLVILGFVIVEYWSRLTAVSIFGLGMVGFSMIAIWSLALRCYSGIHRAFQEGECALVKDDSLAGIAISSAAGMIYWGLFFAYMMTSGTLMQLARVLSNH
jgi:hypothetical protein